MLRAEYELFVNDLHHLALDIGIRPAARAMGISEERAKKIAQRRAFHISQHRQATHAGSRTAASSSPLVPAIEAKRRILAQMSDVTRFNMGRAAVAASDTLADTPGKKLIVPATAIAAQQWSKVADVTHGWTQERAQGNVTVNVANILPPTAQQDTEREATHAKLDAITALLSKPPPAGEGVERDH